MATIGGSAAAAYWSHVEATDSGMLGGLDYVHDVEVRASRRLLEERLVPRLLAVAAADDDKEERDAEHDASRPTENNAGRTPPRQRLRALDCGAGIGRVTRDVLSRYFAQVDLVEPDARFLAHARARGVGSEHFNTRLESFTPDAQRRYHVVWVQWCIIYLDDAPLLEFVRRCLAAVQWCDGCVVVKENVLGGHVAQRGDGDDDEYGGDDDNDKGARNGEDEQRRRRRRPRGDCRRGGCKGRARERVFDASDNSVVRSDAVLRHLFRDAGGRVWWSEAQGAWPSDLLPVATYVVRNRG